MMLPDHNSVEESEVANDIYETIRHIRDPEFSSLSLESLGVVTPEYVHVTSDSFQNTTILKVRIKFKPTTSNCSFASIIGLSIRHKLEYEYLPGSTKFRIEVIEGSHVDQANLNKLMNDKERISAAHENEAITKIIEEAIKDEE